MRRVDPWLFWVLAALVVAVGLAYVLPRLPRVTDMADQPSLKPQEQPLPSPPQSVPLQGRERKVDLLEASELTNPVESTSASVENGQRLYQTYCAVCHGADAKGKGPIDEKLMTPSPDLTQESAAAQPNGYLYVVIREGAAAMPAQAEGLSSQERWDIVNYLRSLQRRE